MGHFDISGIFSFPDGYIVTIDSESPYLEPSSDLKLTAEDEELLKGMKVKL